MDAGRKVASTCGGFGRRSGSRVHSHGWTWNLPGQNGRHWRRFSRLDRWGRPHQRLSGSPRPRKLRPAREESSFQTADTLNREMQGRRRESTTRVCLPGKTCPCERATAEPGARRSLSHRRAAAAAPGFGSGRRGRGGGAPTVAALPRHQAIRVSKTGRGSRLVLANLCWTWSSTAPEAASARTLLDQMSPWARRPRSAHRHSASWM